MDWLNHLIPAIQSYGSFGYWIIFLVSFFEALVFIGSFIPGTFIVIFYGFLASGGYLNLGDLIILATAGAIAGDGLSFYLGSRSQKLFHEKNFLLNTKYLEKSQKFFNKHGNKSIFWGRFIGIIKPFIPFTAGLSGMNRRQFIFWNVFSGIVWAVAHLAVGYFFGGAFHAIEMWTTRLGAFALIAFVFLFVLWFSIKKGEKALEYTVSFIRSTGWSFVNSLTIRWFYHKFPKVYLFIANRLKKDRFWGLPFSFLFISLVLVIISLLDITKNILISGAVVFLDMKVENILVVFRDSSLVKLFLWITALGEAPVVISIVLMSTALFWLWKKRFYIMSLWVAVAGSATSAYIAKLLINRPRPGGNIPVYTEHFFSFPSGHAALTLTLFGFLTYCVWRNYSTWKIRVNSFFLAGALILLVGFSRLYLGVHFLSDVLGGYLFGFFWLLLGIAMSEWLIEKSRRRGGADIIREINDDQQVKKRLAVLKLITGFLIFAELFYVISFITNFKPIFNAVAQNVERQIVVRNISDPLFEKYIPKFPENLTGDYQAPLNFVMVATDDDVFQKDIALAGWLSAEPVGISTVGRTFVSYFKKSEYDTAPVTPLFWHGKANDFAFEKPLAGGEFGARYVVRFWKTDIATEDGGFVYVGSTVLDTDVEYAIFRVTSSDLDTARNQLFNDLMANKRVATYERKQFVDNSKGQYYEKGKYATDGKAYLIYLR